MQGPNVTTKLECSLFMSLVSELLAIVAHLN